MPSNRCRRTPARPSSAEAQRQIAAYLDLPPELRARLDPRRLALAELQRAWVRADREERELAA